MHINGPRPTNIINNSSVFSTPITMHMVLTVFCSCRRYGIYYIIINIYIYIGIYMYIHNLFIIFTLSKICRHQPTTFFLSTRWQCPGNASNGVSIIVVLIIDGLYYLLVNWKLSGLLNTIMYVFAWSSVPMNIWKV